jgi:hypothetical protein
VSEHLFEVGFQKTTTGSAQGIAEIIPATLATGKRPPSVREVGVFNQSGAAAEIGLGQPTAIGVTPAGEVTVQAINTIDTIAGNTVVATSWGTSPSAPTTYRRRAELQALAGAGVIWQWNPDEFILWSGATISTVVLYQISTAAVVYDVYIKVAE